MRKVQATEAKKRLAELLRAVEQFRQRRAGWRRVALSTDEILASRHEGHRL